MITNCTASFLQPTYGERTAQGRPSITYAASGSYASWLVCKSGKTFKDGKASTLYDFELTVFGDVVSSITNDWRVEIGEKIYCIKTITPAYAGSVLHHTIFGLSGV